MYLNLFFTNSDSSRFVGFMSYMEALRALTILTSSMFVLVILYNAEYPSDDRSCSSFKTEQACIARKTFRDKSFCTWEEEECKFTKEQFSINAIIFLAWFELLILAPLGSLIMAIFSLFIFAPTKSNVQNQFKVKHVSVIGRRLSQIGSGVTRQLNNGAKRLSAIGSQVSSGIRRLSTVIQVSDNVVKKKASVRKTTLMENDLIEKRHNMATILMYNHHQRHNHHVIDIDNANDSDIAQALYQKAIESIKAYRRTLSDKELTEFDQDWKTYFPGTEGDNDTITATGRYDEFSQSLYRDISRIQEQSSNEYSYLKDVPPHVCGVEILKMFFIDLLGLFYHHLDIIIINVYC
jgi:hypothetical protein